MSQLAGASVVITGASSGIGRATARAFAARGARVALAARRGEVLEEVARECRALGGEAIVCATDVTDQRAVTALAEAADRGFGGIDIWVNNADLGVIGAYPKVPFDLHRQTIAVNLVGAMHGAYAALPIFLRQGHGTLVNNVSLAAWAPVPFAAAYTASKYGLRGLTASLRQELREFPRIHVCGVFPSIVDTPGFEHGANLSGHNVEPGPYLYGPETVAATIVRLALRPRDEVPVGWPSRAARLAYAVAPGMTERIIGQVARRAMNRAEPAPVREGSVKHPISAGTSPSGGWRKRKGVPNARQINTAAAIAIVGIGALAWAASRGRASRR